jgi:hypothetical protein
MAQKKEIYLTKLVLLMDCHFTEEKKWEKNWEEVKYFSEKYRNLNKLLKILCSLILKISSQLINSTKIKKYE